MSETKELTYTEVKTHNSKKDLYVVIHDKVYNATNFVDEHPGGEEVLLDVGGDDATEAFEDVGHSDEAREFLTDMLIGDLKRQDGDPVPKTKPPPTATLTTASASSGLGMGLYALILLGGVVAFGAYRYLQAQSEQ
ncbi:MAG: hypothetical protein MMC33_001043 [Icmadophila ericetorum]|nr:hypothetical protein [Icmadophila ericetorum]